MSWAKHDIEGWEACCLAGVKAKIAKTRTATLVDDETHILQSLQDDGDAYHIWGALCDFASAEIAEAEVDYLVHPR